MQTPEFQVFWNSAQLLILPMLFQAICSELSYFSLLFVCLIHVLPLVSFLFTISAFTASFCVLCVGGRVCLFKISLFIVDKIYGVVD